MTVVVLAFGAVVVVAALAWSLCRMAADADRRVEQGGRCACCNEPVVGRQLFCDAACQLLWETCP